MAYVFEARRLPFSSITEERYEADKATLLRTARVPAAVVEHLASLPLWDRCMLLAVLPVILDGKEQQQQRRRVGASSPHANVTTTDEENGVSDAGERTDQSADEGQSCSPTPTAVVEVDDVVAGLKMVRALDELEVAWDHIKAVRAGRNGRGDEGNDEEMKSGGGARKRQQPQLTEEELMMDLLLAERGVPGFLCEPQHGAAAEAEEEEEDGGVDIAMCFDGCGDSIGMGSSGVYGGHGFHPL